MRFSRLAPMLVGVALTVGACGDSTGPQVELSEAELTELFTQISDVLSEADVPVFLQPTGVSDLPGLFLSSSAPPVTFTFTGECPGGGSVSVSGSGDETETSFDFTVTETFNACQTDDFTIGGSVTVTGEGSSTETGGDIELNVDGTITVETTDGRSGSCTLDYGMTLTATQTTFSLEVHGTICGRDVEDVIANQ